MKADNSIFLKLAAERKHEVTRSKALDTIKNLQLRNVAITFESVAREAGISRSWLYTQEDIRNEVVRLRNTSAASPRQSEKKKATEESLLIRLTASLERNKELMIENENLKYQLSLALGEVRRHRT